MNPYDVNVVFAELEQSLIMSFKRNMSKYSDTSNMWQAMKLKDLELYRRECSKLITEATSQARSMAKSIISDEFIEGANRVNGFLKGFKLDVKPSSEIDFFRANRRKLNTMIQAAYDDIDRMSARIYRTMDDVYRQTLFKAELAKSSGIYTNEQAIDLATKDFLHKGINCIKYSNGNKVNIASYSEMCIRTSSKRANLAGEGARNQEWGVSLVQVTQHNSTCPLCAVHQGKVYIDDVYSGGKQSDGDYPLLSWAMENGLFHPNCRHTTGTFFEGISSLPETVVPPKVAVEKYQAEQSQRYNERKIREWKRVMNGSMDEDNIRKAKEKVEYWQLVQRQHMKRNDWLRRTYSREKLRV